MVTLQQEHPRDGADLRAFCLILGISHQLLHWCLLRFLHYKVSLFSLWLSAIFWRDPLRQYKYSAPQSIYIPMSRGFCLFHYYRCSVFISSRINNNKKSKWSGVPVCNKLADKTSQGMAETPWLSKTESRCCETEPKRGASSNKTCNSCLQDGSIKSKFFISSWSHLLPCNKWSFCGSQQKVTRVVWQGWHVGTWWGASYALVRMSRFLLPSGNPLQSRFW